ncbi:MAG: carbohydrate hydrolase [Clostridiales bacterium]|nr:MAG: carbohydrate hydrolase [Clostridiales bacterium]
METFLGYRRPDGKVGVRNSVLILPASMCASDVARMVAAQVKNTVTFNNQLGCSQVHKDQQFIMDVMAGYAANPNVYGTVIISLGCENCQMDLVEAAVRERTNKPLAKFIIQEEGGTIRTVEKATRAAMKMVQEASMLQREPCPVTELIVGTECGGSDPTSGLAANVLVGEMSDRLVALGATSILSETTEFIGAEHILAARAKDEAVKDRLYEIIRRYEEHIRSVGEDIRDGNPSPGNKAGGITTLEEKSLGCIHKGGHSIINEVLDYAKPINEKGLVVMDTPGNDMSSIAGMIAGGAQIIAFTSGRGAPTGHPIAPVIKITGNRDTYSAMEDNTDIDASGIIYEAGSLPKLGDRIMQEVFDVAQGKLTKAEVLGFMETAVVRICNFV